MLARGLVSLSLHPFLIRVLLIHSLTLRRLISAFTCPETIHYRGALVCSHDESKLATDSGPELVGH